MLQCDVMRWVIRLWYFRIRFPVFFPFNKFRFFSVCVVFVCLCVCEWVRVGVCVCVWLRECVLDFAISTNFECTTWVEIHFVSFENFLLRFSCVPFNARKIISNAYHLQAPNVRTYKFIVFLLLHFFSPMLITSICGLIALFFCILSLSLHICRKNNKKSFKVPATLHVAS